MPVTNKRKAQQRLRHRWATRNPSPVPLVSTQKSGGALSPVAALALRVVKGWLRVVSRGRGGELRNGVPYTRLKADEVRQQLEREQGVIVSTKTVQRALTQLVTTGHLTRRQLYKHRYNRTYWYAPSEREQAVEAHRPRVVAAAFAESKQSSRPSQPVLTEGTQASLQALRAQVSPSTLQGQDSQTAQQPGTETSAAGVQEAPEEAVSREWGRRGRQAVKAAPGGSGRLERAQQALAAAVQRAAARGFGQTTAAQHSNQALNPRYIPESAQGSGFLR